MIPQRGEAGLARSRCAFNQGPGQVDEIYILDVNGLLVALDTGPYAGTLPTVVDELRGIVESATVEMP